MLPVEDAIAVAFGVGVDKGSVGERGSVVEKNSLVEKGRVKLLGESDITFFLQEG